MRKLLFSLCTIISLQTPVFAQVRISTADLHKLGEQNGIAYCGILRAGVTNEDQFFYVLDKLNKPDLNYLARIWGDLSPQQKDVVLNGMDQVISNYCEVLYQQFKRLN